MNPKPATPWRIPCVVSLLLAGFLASQPTLAKDGENWEISTQVSQAGGPLGPAQVQRLCFAKGKDMKEPPADKDDSCKTSVQQSGKRASFKSVCKYPDQTITSSGFSEEVGPNHFRSDITITTEEKGRRSEQRQVGNIKKLAGTCDPNEFMRALQMQMQQGLRPEQEPAPPAAANTTAPPAAAPDNQSLSSPPAKEEKSGTQSLIEAGKGLLRGRLPF